MLRMTVTGAGMTTAVGFSAGPACAAIRAGITRPAPLPLSVLSSDEPEAEAVVGHPHPDMEGMGLVARLIRLGAWAVEDLVRSSGIASDDASSWGRTALLPCLARTRAEDWEFVDELLAEDLAERIVGHLGTRLPLRLLAPVFDGNTAVLTGLLQASELLASREVDRAIVLGVDSLVTAETLEWLVNRDMLKTPERPVGLMPGEAAACLLVESDAAVRARKAQIRGHVEQVETAKLAGPGSDRSPGMGRALAKLLLDVWPSNARVGEVYGDLNGANLRAEVWGHVNVHLRSERDLDAIRLELAALSLGDTGAASGAIAIALALHSYARRYARGDASLVFGVELGGHVAAARVTGPEGTKSQGGGR